MHLFAMKVKETYDKNSMEYINNELKYLGKCKAQSSWRYDSAMLLALSVRNVP